MAGQERAGRSKSGPSTWGEENVQEFYFCWGGGGQNSNSGYWNEQKTMKSVSGQPLPQPRPLEKVPPTGTGRSFSGKHTGKFPRDRGHGERMGPLCKELGFPLEPHPHSETTLYDTTMMGTDTFVKIHRLFQCKLWALSVNDVGSLIATKVLLWSRMSMMGVVWK